MRARMLGAAAACAAVGLIAVNAAPHAWRLEWRHGLLLGTALYMGVLHRWLARGDASSALAPRAAVFVALLALQGYAYFEWLPPVDLRAPFVLLSGWIVTETLFQESREREARRG